MTTATTSIPSRKSSVTVSQAGTVQRTIVPQVSSSVGRGGEELVGHRVEHLPEPRDLRAARDEAVERVREARGHEDDERPRELARSSRG